jgi:hypothetical protein
MQPGKLNVAQTLVSGASRLISTRFGNRTNLRPAHVRSRKPETSRHECRDGRHECLRHIGEVRCGLI